MAFNEGNRTLPRGFSTLMGFDAVRDSAGRDHSGLRERYLENDTQPSSPLMSDITDTPQSDGASESVGSSSTASKPEDNSTEFNSNSFDELVGNSTKPPHDLGGNDFPNNDSTNLPDDGPKFGPYVPDNNTEATAYTSSTLSQVPGLTSDAPTPVDATDARTPEPQEVNSSSALRIHQGDSDVSIVAKYEIDDALSKINRAFSAYGNATPPNALVRGNHRAQIDRPAALEGRELLLNAKFRLIDLQDLESGEYHRQPPPRDRYYEEDDDEEDTDHEDDDHEDDDHCDTFTDAGTVLTLAADSRKEQETFTPTSAQATHGEDIEAALRRITNTVDREGIPDIADRKKSYELVVDAALHIETLKSASTIWGSVEEARREMESKVVRPKHDDTIPRTVAQKRALVKVLFTIITDVEYSTDNPKMLQKFIKDWESKAKEIELFCWEVVDLMIKRCTEGPLSSGTQFHGNFKLRMAAMIECLHYRKTSFLSALRPTFLQRLVDNPREKMNQSESNQRGNKKKGDDIKVGRRARAAERAASDTTASKTRSRSQNNAQSRKQQQSASVIRKATVKPRKNARRRNQGSTQSQNLDMRGPSMLRTLQPYPQTGQGGNRLECILETPFPESHWATGHQQMQNGGGRQSSILSVASQRQTAYNPSFYMTPDTRLSSQPYQQIPVASPNSISEPSLGTFTHSGSSSMDHDMHVVYQAQPEQHQQFHHYPAHLSYSTNNRRPTNLKQGTSQSKQTSRLGVPPYSNQNPSQPQEIHESSIMLENASTSNAGASGLFRSPQSTAADFRQTSFQRTDSRVSRERSYTDDGYDHSPVPTKRLRR
ncbi:hypothetical protein BDW60DRAFT_221973 [Aspergillus nidulans var. acristatus]